MSILTVGLGAYKNLGMQRIAVKPSNDRTKIAAASYDGTIRIFEIVINPKTADFDTEDLTPALANDEKVGPANFRVATDVVWGIAGTPSKNLIFGGYERLREGRGFGEVKVFKEQKQSIAMVHRYEVGENAVACLALSPSGECTLFFFDGARPMILTFLPPRRPFSSRRNRKRASPQ